MFFFFFRYCSFEVEASRKHGNIDEFVGFLKSSGGLIKHQKQHPDKENLIEKTKERYKGNVLFHQVLFVSQVLSIDIYE